MTTPLAAAPATSGPVVRAGRIHRPVPIAVDEIVVRGPRGEVRRLFWTDRGFAPHVWGERPA